MKAFQPVGLLFAALLLLFPLGAKAERCRWFLNSRPPAPAEQDHTQNWPIAYPLSVLTNKSVEFTRDYDPSLNCNRIGLFGEIVAFLVGDQLEVLDDDPTSGRLYPKRALQSFVDRRAEAKAELLRQYPEFALEEAIQKPLEGAAFGKWAERMREKFGSTVLLRKP